MAEPTTVTEAQERAEALLERAGHHKREARRHRRRARATMEEFKRLREFCERRGFSLVYQSRHSPEEDRADDERER